MSDANIGWGGSVSLHNGATPGALVELVEVTEFDIPDDQVGEQEVTHLKSPGKRREFLATLIDGGSVTVTMNLKPGSATDVLVRAAKASGKTRAVTFTLPKDDGTPGWVITTSCFVKGYNRGKVSPDGVMKAVAMLRITGDQAEAAA